MPPLMVPESFALLLAAFAPCFTAPTYHTFCYLVAGWLQCPGRHTVTGVAIAAGRGGVAGLEHQRDAELARRDDGVRPRRAGGQDDGGEEGKDRRPQWAGGVRHEHVAGRDGGHGGAGGDDSHPAGRGAG